MLKYRDYDEIKFKIKHPKIGSGCFANVYDIGNGLVCKKYYTPEYINNIWYETNKLFHFANLNKINLNSFITPLEICIKREKIIAIIMKKAKGKIYYKQDLNIENIINFEQKLRQDVEKISNYFIMYDFNRNSLFFDNQQGFSIIDLDFYIEANGQNYLKNNLFTVYYELLYGLNINSFTIINVLKSIESNKSLDYFRLEYILKVIDEKKEKTLTRTKK